MLQDERQTWLVQYLKENQSIRIGEMARMLGVTRETLRRDLYELEKQGIVKKVHGGAILMKATDEPSYETRAMTHMEEKERIARKAAEFVENGDALYIDNGTTALLFARQLQDKKITVITNSLLAALELIRFPGIKLLLCGGEVRNGDLSLSGVMARKSIEGFYVDKAFIGVGGLGMESGLTDYHVEESEVRSLVLSRAKETFALTDSSKFFVTAFSKVADLSEIDWVITDSGISEGMKGSLEEAGVRIVIC